MKHHRIIFWGICILLFPEIIFSQIHYKLSLLSDQETYQVSMVSDVTVAPPFNLTASGQITIKVPHGEDDTYFEIKELTNLISGVTWSNNSRTDAPIEEPCYDYISFGLISLGTSGIEYEAGIETPIFSFKNGATLCTDSISLFDNDLDAFRPPNSLNINVGNQLTILGGNGQNAYTGNIGTGKAPCTPTADCEVVTFIDSLVCEIPIDTGDEFCFLYSEDDCDSLVIVNYIVQPPDTMEIVESICPGDYFQNSPYYEDTIIWNTYSNMLGCDSFTVTYLSILPEFEDTIQQILVEGQIFNGQVFEEDTVFTESLTNQFGCDSLVTYEISVVSIPSSVQNISLCEGDEYDGQIYLEDTSLTDTLTSWLGIDSLSITNLWVLDESFSTQKIEICYGEEVNGVPLFQNTILEEEYTGFNGCDSIIQKEIIVHQEYDLFIQQDLCEGDIYEGKVYFEDTVFQKELATDFGCDSLVEISISVYPNPEAQIIGEEVLCEGESQTLLAGGNGSYIWSTGNNSPSIDISQSGEYGLTVTNSFGCTANNAINVAVHLIDANIFETLEGCGAEAKVALQFDHISGGEAPYLFSLDGGNSFTTEHIFNNLIPNTYDMVVEDVWGCRWEEEQTFVAPPSPFVELGQDEFIAQGEDILINTITNLDNPSNILWTPSEGLSCTNCLNPIANPFENTSYQLIITNEQGCTASDEIQIFVDKTLRVYVPNAFSPNGDGINDQFMIYANNGVQSIQKWTIFSRWGELVFQAEDFEPESPQHGWNGKYKGKALQSDTYTWQAEILMVDGKIELLSGAVHLIR